MNPTASNVSNALSLSPREFETRRWSTSSYSASLLLSLFFFIVLFLLGFNISGISDLYALVAWWISDSKTMGSCSFWIERKQRRKKIASNPSTNVRSTLEFLWFFCLVGDRQHFCHPLIRLLACEQCLDQFYDKLTRSPIISSFRYSSKHSNSNSLEPTGLLP